MRSLYSLFTSTHLLLLAALFPFNTLTQLSNLPALTDTAADGKTATSAASKPSPLQPSPSKAAPASTPTKAASTTLKPIVNPSSDSAASETAAPESNLPALTSSISTSDQDGLVTTLPKLAEDDYPAPTVPPTANAPFMQKSTLPEGTVFICVGAFLGFIALVVLAWRGLVAWSLHRSVRRAALAQSAKYTTGAGRGVKIVSASGRHSRAPFYNPGPGSTLSLDQLGVSSRNGTHKSSAGAARESLFFSPTAGAGGMQAQQQGPRGSGYLPAGYYAAGTSAAGGGGGIGMSHLNSDAHSSFSNLVPHQPNGRYSRARSLGPSPPGSPSLPPSSRGADINGGGGGAGAYGAGFRRPSTVGLAVNASHSSLNLSPAPHSRAPSAYLDDLFENHRPGT